MRKLWNWTVYRVDQAFEKVKSAILTIMWCMAYGLWAAFVLSGALIVGRVLYNILSQVCPQILVLIFCAYVTLQIWDWAERAGGRVAGWLDSKLDDIRDILPGWDHD